jgi:large subunit ribosomal protein L19
MNGRGIARSITVRRIVQGEGVERVFPLHNPRVKDVVTTRRGDVRRSKLYYLRDRVGKSTRVKELLGSRSQGGDDSEAAAESAPQPDQTVEV